MQKVSKSEGQHIDYNINCKMINIYCTNTKGSNYIIKSWKTKNTDASQQNNVQINFNITNSTNNHKSESKSFKNSFNCTQYNEKEKNYSSKVKQKLNNSEEIPEKTSSLFYRCSVCSVEKCQKYKTIDEINWREYTNSLEEIHLSNKRCDFKNKIKRKENIKRIENQTYFNHVTKFSEPQYNLNNSFKKINKTTYQSDNINKYHSIVKPKYISIKMDDVFFRIIKSLKEKVNSIISISFGEAFIIQCMMMNKTIDMVKRIKKDTSKMKSLLKVIYFHSKDMCVKLFNNEKVSRNIHTTLLYFKSLLTAKRLKYFVSTKSRSSKTNGSTNFNHKTDPLILIANELKEIKEILKSCKLHLDEGRINNEIIPPKVYTKYAITTNPLPPPTPPPLPPINIFQKNKNLTQEKKLDDTIHQRPVITVEALKSVQLRKVPKLSNSNK